MTAHRKSHLPLREAIAVLNREYERNRDLPGALAAAAAAAAAAGQVPAILAPAPVARLPRPPAGLALLAIDDDPWYGMFCAPRGWDTERTVESADAAALAGQEARNVA